MGVICKSRNVFVLLTVFLVVAAGGVAVQGAEQVGQIRPKVGFELQKVGARYEPVARHYQPFRLPGTTMRFGTYTYFSPLDEEIGVPKWGFRPDSGRFFYLNEPFAQNSDPHYALVGGYFIVDGGAGGSGICRSMYLFGYGKNSMKLLDMIGQTPADILPTFMTDHSGKPAYGHKPGSGRDDPPVWIVKERDREGHPLVRLKMILDIPVSSAGPEEFDTFHIYLRVAHGKLRVALDPYLYAPLFESLGEGGGPESRSSEYYVSGFLSGKVSLGRIKAELQGIEERAWLVNCLKNVRKWDGALHERFGEPLPGFREYKLKRR